MTQTDILWHDSDMPKNPKKTSAEPEHFQLAHEIAEDAIGGPLFQPKPIRIRPPKPLRRSTKTASKKTHRLTTKKRTTKKR
jgi:hypothetical protein